MTKASAPEEQVQALVPVTDMAATDFSHRVSLPGEGLVQALRERSDVIYEEGRPNPFPMGAGEFQAWRKGEVIFLRRLTLPGAAKSPFVALRVSQDGGAYVVRGAFVRRPVVRNDGTQTLLKFVLGLMWLMLVVNLVALGFGEAFFNLPRVLMVLFGLPVGHALLRQGERPATASMEAHGRALRSLVGELLIPHELGSGDAPFRALAGARDGRHDGG